MTNNKSSCLSHYSMSSLVARDTCINRRLIKKLIITSGKKVSI